MSSDVALDYNGFLFEEPEVPPAEEASDVPLDGDGSPCLSATPLFLQLLVQKLLEEQLTKGAHTYVSMFIQSTQLKQCHKWEARHLC